MNMKLSKKSKIAGIGIIVFLVFSMISLAFVKGDKPPDIPPTGIISEIFEILDSLGLDIDAEEAARIAADAALQADINALQDALVAAYTTLQANIDAEILDRIDAITAEATARVEADMYLQQQVNDLNTRVPQVGYVSIPAAAFRPGALGVFQGKDWRVSDTGLANLENTGDANFFAPVFLPHGVRVTDVTMYYSDPNPGKEIHLRLERAILSEGMMYINYMAEITSIDDEDFASDATIAFAIIDKSYAYNIEVEMSPHTPDEPMISFKYVIITYEYPA